MLYREIITVCSQIHKKHINSVCVCGGGGGAERKLFNIKLVVHIVTNGL
jgi:hypothetical protein